MATLDDLKRALREDFKLMSRLKRPLSDAEISVSFDTLLGGSEWMTYQDFIIPQLSELLTLFSNSRSHISVLEIGPGPMRVLRYLPSFLRRKIRKYTALEPNYVFATKLEEDVLSISDAESPLPCLEMPAKVHRIPFVLLDDHANQTSFVTRAHEGKYDLIIFCHSMYGMKPKHKFIEQALKMLVEQPLGGMVVVFHRATLQLEGLVCHRVISFPTGVASVANRDEALDAFAPFIAGFTMQHVDVEKDVKADWRKICRALGQPDEDHQGHLSFSSPSIMMAFTQHATSLPNLTAQVPVFKGNRTIKNREARLHRPASILRPTTVQHVQQCVRWAVKHKVGLTVIGGGHSGHCLWPNVVAIDMSSFDQIRIVKAGAQDEEKLNSYTDSFAVVESGCTIGEIIEKTDLQGFAVPLGACPSVGAGLWLQGGIGHLNRRYGLSCDAIVGAVVVSVDSGEILCVGHVPIQHWPVGAVRPENENDLLWALKGAGTNFGIVISVTFKAVPAPVYALWKWVVPLRDASEAQLKLNEFEEIAMRKLSQKTSVDMYLYWHRNQLQLGVARLESPAPPSTFETKPTPDMIDRVMELERSFEVVYTVDLFDTEMYISTLNCRQGDGKTSSFKRCLFLKRIGAVNVATILVQAIETRPSPDCYLHITQGGRAVGDVAADATAFGCRDWEFAVVVTGLWERDQDGTEVARATVQWVYKVMGKLLPLSSGVYGADLGPDPRDRALAAKGFGPNLPHLVDLKSRLDPHSVLAYACPLLRMPMGQKLIILITGESCAGKDYCADIWVSMFTNCPIRNVKARTVSISEQTKREYATKTSANLRRLLWDRAYKEQHRPALTKFFSDQVQDRPQMLEEHFLNVVRGAADVDVLLITGMREEYPLLCLIWCQRADYSRFASEPAEKQDRFAEDTAVVILREKTRIRIWRLWTTVPVSLSIMTKPEKRQQKRLPGITCFPSSATACRD